MRKCRYSPEELRKTYLILQDEWIRVYDIRHGDTVKVLRKAKSYELGWGDAWHFDMNHTVGETFGILGLLGENGIQLNCLQYHWQVFPFFVLEKQVRRGDLSVRTISMKDVYEKFGYNIRLEEEG